MAKRWCTSVTGPTAITNTQTQSILSAILSATFLASAPTFLGTSLHFGPKEAMALLDRVPGDLKLYIGGYVTRSYRDQYIVRVVHE